MAMFEVYENLSPQYPQFVLILGLIMYVLGRKKSDENLIKSIKEPKT